MQCCPRQCYATGIRCSIPNNVSDTNGDADTYPDTNVDADANPDRNEYCVSKRVLA